jgi:GNAT superfamily N-acetyltransferase
LACEAALDAGVPGRFRVWEETGLMAVLATDPALGFLSTVSGVARETVSATIDLVNAPVWNGVKPTVVVSAELGEAVGPLLSAAGLVRTGDRILAVRRLEARRASAAGAHSDVVDAGEDDTFLHVLLAGYEVDGVAAAFIRAEHGLPVMRRFLVLERGAPIAAAAMTIHGDVAVLGGASTLPAHRGRGAQSRLLQHRIRIAAEAGCVLAVATARPESVSAANLRRAGFRIHRRSAWMA